MSTRKTLLVLDDDLLRVEWLRDHVPTGTDVQWVATVDAFAVTLTTCTPDLIILDHDLGENSASGVYACDHIPDNCKATIIVWSMNPVGAANMTRTLQRRGLSVLRAEFGNKLLPVVMEAALR